MKRMLTAISILITLLLCACGPSQSGEEGPDYTPTIPQTPTGAVSDSIPHRFVEQGETLYFSAGDSVLCLQEEGMQLLFTADTPDYLFITGDYLIHREVAERGEDNTPLEYRVVRRALADPQRETLLFRGDVQWVYEYRETVWMMTAEGDLVKINVQADTSGYYHFGISDLPAAWGDQLYFADGEAVRVMDLNTEETSLVLTRAGVMNLFAYEDHLCFTTEESGVLEMLRISSGEITLQEDLPCVGLTVQGDNLSYVQNSDGEFSVKIYDGERIRTGFVLGRIRECSEPYFTEEGTYLYLGSDDYYGLVLVDPAGQISYLEASEG